ncbi:HEAT repeat domain-containing protein [Thermocoleostomius sinensis]|uniref:HEAT repeat domain-containing protein n=1 Tax=Thermocoleostomius sinensis A174 TaxID=2016057 RepID=A0A9E9C8D1_9CYAN|nr:HEAT repeat domain-containing protein [Thermocoleostomius sinensis]WAL58307.1 HEAT repeat domain-containing protein [Thermocoleostomius sinensis A174]
MSYRLKLLFIIWLTCFSIAPNAIAKAETTDQVAEPPVSQTSARMEWIWWGAIALVPVTVVAGIFYSLHPRQSVQQPTSPISDPVPPHPQSDSIVLSSTTRLTKVDSVEALIQDLGSTDPQKRRSAIWELGQCGDSRAIQPLVDLLIDADSKQRALILAAVSEIGTRTLKPMQRALMISLQDDSSEVRKNAIRDVSRNFEWMAQVSQALQYATSDPDTEVRETAEWALGQLNRVRLPTSERTLDTPSAPVWESGQKTGDG